VDHDPKKSKTKKETPRNSLTPAVVGLEQAQTDCQRMQMTTREHMIIAFGTDSWAEIFNPVNALKQ
jgi:hypothetical protein